MVKKILFCPAPGRRIFEESTLRCTSTIDPLSCFWLLAATEIIIWKKTGSTRLGLTVVFSFSLTLLFYALKDDCSFLKIQIPFGVCRLSASLCAYVWKRRTGARAIEAASWSSVLGRFWLLRLSDPQRHGESQAFVVLDVFFFFVSPLAFAIARPLKKWLHWLTVCLFCFAAAQPIRIWSPIFFFNSLFFPFLSSSFYFLSGYLNQPLLLLLKKSCSWSI